MKISNKFLLAASLGLGAFFTARFIRKRNPYNFEGKVVLITGGSRGLGLAIARKLAAEGAKVAICARDQDEVFRAQAQLENISPEIYGVPSDITDRTQANRMIKAVRERFGDIDVLINNAGIIQIGPYNTMTIEDYEDAMAIHFWAPLYTILAVLPKMRSLRTGRIVNISSIGGKVSVPHLLPYSASKFALTGLSEGLRAELKKEGIVVTTVCPGLMRTGSTRNVDVKGQHEEEYKWFSVSGSLPFTSVSVEYAAEKIIDGCRYGDAEVILSIPAKVATAFHGVFPGLTSVLLSGINKILPDSAGEGAMEKRKGYESESALSQSFLTDPNKKAAEDNNEI
jgi:NAD(P)-dependent dehydrogenase (short-subunit alcohol dehydrogenase family)